MTGPGVIGAQSGCASAGQTWSTFETLIVYRPPSLWLTHATGAGLTRNGVGALLAAAADDPAEGGRLAMAV